MDVTKMGDHAHIIYDCFAKGIAPAGRAIAAGRHDSRAGLWRQIGRELIDRHAILAEHPVQSGGLHGIYVTITGTRRTAGT